MTPVPAHIGQVPWLVSILWSFTRATPWLPKARSRVTDLQLMARVTCRGWVRVIRDHRGPAGFIVQDGMRIHALFVHPRARGQGMGRALLDDAKSRTGRLELWVLQANGTARKFYALQGFYEAARSPGHGNDENLPDILMVWQAPDDRKATA